MNEIVPISQEIEQAILRFIRTKWEDISPHKRPWGVWIRRYAAMRCEAEGVSIAEMPLRVWFLDATGIHEASVWSWRRVVAVHFGFDGQVWDYPRYSNPFYTNYELGLVAFAPITPDKTYCEWQWGRLWGQGSQLSLSEGKIIGSTPLWTS